MITKKKKYLYEVEVGTKSQMVCGTIYDAQRVERIMSEERPSSIEDARKRQLQIRIRLHKAA